MGRSGRALGLVALSLLALGAPAGAGAAEPVRCASIKTVRVSDLGMTPSPLPQGEAVQRWVAKLEVAGSGEGAVRLRVAGGLGGGARPLDGPRFCAKRQSGSPPAFTLE